MPDSVEAEARLRRSLAGLRQEVADLVASTYPAKPKDSFEGTLRDTFDRMIKLLGFRLSR